MLKAVFFDAAGTLFEAREPVGHTYARIARKHGLNADDTRGQRRISPRILLDAGARIRARPPRR